MTAARLCLWLAVAMLSAVAMVPMAAAAPVDMIAERKTPSSFGDLILLRYPSFNDLKNGTNLTQFVLPLGNNSFSPEFNIAGLTTDGNAQRLLAERVVPSGFSDLILLSYPSLDDLKNGTNLTQLVLPLGNSLLPEFDIAGLTRDGAGYRLLAERVVPIGFDDLILLSYPSFDDLKNGTNLTQLVLPLGNSLLPEFDIHGLDIPPDAPVNSVPEPTTLALLFAGLAAATLARHGRAAAARRR